MSWPAALASGPSWPKPVIRPNTSFGLTSLGNGCVAERHDSWRPLRCRQAAERRAPIAQRLEQGIAEIVESAVAASAAADIDERRGIADARTRAKKKRVGQREDRGRRRHPRGQGEHRRECEDRAAEKQANGVAQVRRGRHGEVDEGEVRKVS